MIRPSPSTYFDWETFQDPKIRLGILFLWVLVLTPLSYLPGLGIRAQLWLAIMGVALPFLIATIAAWKKPLDPGKARFSHISPPGTVWVLFAIGGVLFSRFFLVGAYSNWPLIDEAVHGYLSLRLSEQWDWSLFRYVSQMPPFHFWAQALLYKGLGTEIKNLWLLPACLSALTALLALGGAFYFRTPGWTRWAAVYLAVSFWPAYLGRLAHPAVWVPLWMVGTILATVHWANVSRRSDFHTLLLGVWTGLGFYTYLSWPAAFAGWAFVVLGCAPKGKRCKTLCVWGLGAAGAVLPLALGALREGFGSYYWYLLTQDPGGRGSFRRIEDALGYLKTIWFGGIGTYQPAWGGFLNPLAGACALAGWVEAVRWRRDPRVPWIFAGAMICFLPALFSTSVNPLRIVQVVPLLAWVAVLGAVSATSVLRGRARVSVLAFLLVSSVLLDSYHLGGAARTFWTRPDAPWSTILKTRSGYLAAQHLKETERLYGPGRLWLGFQLEMTDQSLAVAQGRTAMGLTAKGPFDPRSYGWAAWICDAHYRPFLQKRFPHFRWHDLRNTQDPAETCGLAVVPMSDFSQEEWSRWAAVDRAFGKVFDVYFKRKERESFDAVIRAYQEMSGLIEGDRWLVSVYCEKLNLAFQLDALFGSMDKRRDFLGSWDVLGRAVEQGYPAAHLWNELGSLREMAGDVKGAKKCYRNAVASPANFTPAAENLARLEKQKAGTMPVSNE